MSLSAAANKLETGRIVDDYLPVETWMKHVVVYPQEVVLPEQLDGRESLPDE